MYRSFIVALIRNLELSHDVDDIVFDENFIYKSKKYSNSVSTHLNTHYTRAFFHTCKIRHLNMYATH